MSEDFRLKGEVSWSETSIFDVDNQLELEKLCEFKKRVSEKIE